jgi:hypothetical protein
MNVTWIVFTKSLANELVKTAAKRRTTRTKGPVRREERVLTVAAPRPESLPTLHGLFAHVIGDSPRFKWLRKDQLSEVLFNPSIDRSELFIAASSDPATETITLIRGDCQQFVLPFAFFELSGDGTKPDFSRVRITDSGRTVAFGSYEASADAILYETDPDYRKKLHRQREQHEMSFGASLRRLRKQRRLKRNDFAPLSAKTIARIERSEIGKPHAGTLKVLAQRLRVPADEIGDY